MKDSASIVNNQTCNATGNVTKRSIQENIVADNKDENFASSDINQIKNETDILNQRVPLEIHESNGDASETTFKNNRHVVAGKVVLKIGKKIHSKNISDDGIQIDNLKENPVVQLLEAQGFKCEHCPYSTKDKSRITIHMRKHTGEKPFSCPHCSFTCAHSATLRYHKFAHAEKKYSCKICGHKSTILSSLKAHMEAVHSDGKKFACTKCPYKGSTKKNLQYHTRTHTPRLKCPHCDYMVDVKCRLKVHVATHARDLGLEGGFECSLCSYKGYTASHVSKHMKVQHVDLICDLCGDVLEGRDKLFEHKQKHVKKRFLCDQCGYTASIKSTFSLHMQLNHTLEAPNVKECPHCFKRVLNGNYKRHLRTHNVICKICNRDFRTSSNLAMHNRIIHFNEKYSTPDEPEQEGLLQ